MIVLFCLILVLIAYGSLYPFDFSTAGLTGDAVEHFLQDWTLLSSPGDQLGNIALFMPYGLIGMLALRGDRAAAAKFLALAIFGGILAAWLQALQLLLPTRDAAMGDIAWNMLGLAAGAAAAMPRPVREAFRQRGGRPSEIVPVVLVACWMVAELAPFVPSIDFQSFKDSVRPVWQTPDFSLSEFFRAAIGWTIIAYFARRSLREGPAWLVLFLAMAGTVTARIVIVDNVVTLSDLAALAAAFAAALLLARFERRAAAILLGLLSAYAILSALEPFGLSETGRFHWIPFAGSLGGSMLLNLKAMAGKIFVIGAIYYLSAQCRLRMRQVVPVAVAAYAVLEIAQLWIGDHTPEITDPLLAAAIGIGFVVLQKRAGMIAPPPAERPRDAAESLTERPDAPPAARAGLLSRPWLLPPRWGLAALAVAAPASALAIEAVLGLPKIPYNVRELFGGDGAWWQLFIFALAIFSFGIGGTVAGHRTARSDRPWLTLPATAILACIATYILLAICVSAESLADIAGSSNTYHFVTERKIWGEWGDRVYRLIGSQSLIAAAERIVRFTALFGPLFLWIALATALYFRLSDGLADRTGTGRRASVTASLSCLPTAALMLYGFKVIAFNRSSTDNLNELIQGNGAYLYPLLLLLPANMVALVHATVSPRLRNIVAAVLTAAVSLPVGWVLFRYGLSAPVEKYGQVFTGADFLLGPDRQDLLPQSTIMIRWMAIQLCAVIALAFGMRIMLPLRRPAHGTVSGPPAPAERPVSSAGEPALQP